MPITGDGYFCLVKPVIYVTKEGMKMKGHMDKVLAAAAAAAKAGEVPVAAAITDANGDLIAVGGRVLAVTALGDDAETARRNAYVGVAKIDWQGGFYRSDIAKT
jgi:phosphoribosylamine-glycine ligase